MGEQPGETIEEKKDGKEKEIELETETSTEESLTNLDNDSKQEEDSAEINIEEMYEQSLRQIQEGELITGEIIKIDEEYVLVDIGYKSEGIIPIREFKDTDGKVTAKAGDKVDVVLERKENDEGVVTLSMERAKKNKGMGSDQRYSKQRCHHSGKSYP